MGRLSESYFIKADKLLHNTPLHEYHIHTSYTDGENTAKEVVDESIRLGLKQIIFTEHTEPWFAKNKNWFGAYADEIVFFQNKFKDIIEIKIGIETPAIDFLGNIEISEEMDTRCDYILGAAHRYPGLEGKRVQDLSANEAIELEFKTLMGLAGNKNIDALAHIGGTCLKYCSEFPRSMMVEIIREATKNNIAIEINHQYHQPLQGIIDICVQENASVVLGSNAHKLSEVGSVYRAIIECNENKKG